MADIEITNIEEVKILGDYSSDHEKTQNDKSTDNPNSDLNNDENTDVPQTPVMSLFDKRILKEREFLESEAMGFEFEFWNDNMTVETTRSRYKGVKIFLQISKQYPLFEP